MSIDADALYKLLPAIYRIRDVEQGEPLKALLSVIAEQVAVLEEDLAQLYDDQFIETCAEWVVPYIGDLIGASMSDRALRSGAITKVRSSRAEVANTIAYRRRKGTAAMLEQLARDVTGWNARVVEFFQLLATTQYMNHLRLNNRSSPDLRQWQPLEFLNTPFDSLAHTVDVRRITSKRGRYNIPNIGIFLWRIGYYSLTRSPAYKVDDRRYLFSPLGNNTQLFTKPQTENEITHLADLINVPAPISSRVLNQDLEDAKKNNIEPNYYGKDKSLLIIQDEREIPPERITICNLSDNNGEWAHKPQDKIAIDPVLGRIAFPENQPPPQNVSVIYHYGFSADIGGGEYDRREFITTELQPIRRVLDEYTTIQEALRNFPEGVVEITNSNSYTETLSINVANDNKIELRAANRCRPTLILSDELSISGDENAEVTLNGLLICGKTLRVSGNFSLLKLQHCTLVPGLSLSIAGEPNQPNEPSLIVDANTTVEIDRCIVGKIRVTDNAIVRITNSIVDATSQEGVAYAALNDNDAGGQLYIENSTVIGKVHTVQIKLASNTIFLANLTAVDTWTAPIRSERVQDGCIRFSYLPIESQAPRGYYCQPDLALAQRVKELGLQSVNALSPSERISIIARMQPLFTSLRYGNPGYCQLSQRCAVEIQQGADDDAEMGAFHDLYQPQRETNLRVRLDEYLRFGLEAGIFYVTSPADSGVLP